jgi:hypothetical protein
MSEANDDLGEILAPKPGQSQAGLFEKLLLRTENRLIRQRWARRSGRIGSFALVFLLGGSLGWLARPVPASVPVPVPQPEVVFVPLIVPVPTPVDSGSSGTRDFTLQLSGSDTELQAEQADDPNAVAKLYKLAGDAFLRDQDYANASRCYRHFLVRAGDVALSINPDDSWLLTSLKNAVFKEKSYVSKNDS